MHKHNVVKPSIRYTLLFRFVQFYFRIYYRRITATGKEQIPKDVPLIFAANHQNALMDALAILFVTNRPVVFLARADIFKKKAVAGLLHLLKMLPVYRMRDGVDSMGKNQEVFEQTVQVLESGTPLALLPEGTHTSIKRLQQLKKGICRIAFTAAESSDFKLNIHIVPVGLDYAHYQNAGTHLLVNYGQSIPVSDYYDLYHENPQKAIAQLRDDLADALKKVMIHVENAEFYQTIQSLTEILVPTLLQEKGQADNRISRFVASQEIIGRIHAAIEENRLIPAELKEETEQYQHLLDQYGLKNKLMESGAPSFLSLILAVFVSVLLLPLHLYGMISSYLPYKIPEKVSGNMKDKQFISSINFGLSFLLFPLWYLILFAVLLIITAQLIPSILALISWPLAGLFAFYHYKHLRKLAGKIRLFNLKRRHPDQYNQLVDLRQKLVLKLGQI